MILASTLIALAVGNASPERAASWNRLPVDQRVRIEDYRRASDAECPDDYVLHLCNFAVAVDLDSDGETEYVRAMVNRRTGGASLVQFGWGEDQPPRLIATWSRNIWRLAYLNAPPGSDVIELVQPESHSTVVRWNRAGFLEQLVDELPGD